MSRSFALASAVVLGATLAAPSFADGGRHWVATWATSPASFFVYTAPVPPVYPPGAPTTFAPANIQPDLVFPFPDAATGATANDQTEKATRPACLPVPAPPWPFPRSRAVRQSVR
jgi:hypothetical protein